MQEYQVRRRVGASQLDPRPDGGWDWPKIVKTIAILVVGSGLLWFVVTQLFAGDTQERKAPARSVRAGFPKLAEDGFSESQREVVRWTREEYQRNPTGYDDTVMKYTEGFEESWCADFISWVFYQAGTPFIHPDTGYWRIPGVQTLRAYYEELGAYHDINDEYTPQLGDVLFYFGETPDGDNAEHVAMVLAVDGDHVTTIGGNEGDGKGILRVRTDAYEYGVKGLTAIGASGIGS